MNTTVVTGIDLVYLPRFKKALKSGGESFLHRVFHKDELTNKELAHLAGIFAAKEAVIKGLGLQIDNWQDIKVSHKLSGAPKVAIINHQSSIINHAISISHDGNYVVAVFTALVKK